MCKEAWCKGEASHAWPIERTATVHSIGDAVGTIELDPAVADLEATLTVPAVAKLLHGDAFTYTRKAADYAPDPTDPWENFTFAADVAARICRGLPGDDKRRATALLIGLKVSRLMTVGLAGKASNEAITDTLGDLRVYAAILQAQNADATKVP